ncbi:hypothetical protein ACQP3J_27015, partial [Escherichia coli]
GDTTTKAAYKSRHLIGGWLTVFEGSPWSSWWAAWQHAGKQASRHGIRAVAESLHLISNLEAEK